MTADEITTALQILRIGHGKWTQQVRQDDGTEIEVACCACGVRWPCTIGVVVAAYDDLEARYRRLEHEYTNHQRLDQATQAHSEARAACG